MGFAPRVAKEDDAMFEAVLVAAACPERKGCLLSDPVSCEAGVAEMRLPADWAGHKVFAYGFVRRKGLMTSDSVYVGRLVF